MTVEKIRQQAPIEIIRQMGVLQTQMEELDEQRTKLYAQYHRLWTRLELIREGAKTSE